MVSCKLQPLNLEHVQIVGNEQDEVRMTVTHHSILRQSQRDALNADIGSVWLLSHCVVRC